MKRFETELKHQLNTLSDLSLIYTPGVGFSCKEIEKDAEKLNTLTNRKNSLAVIFEVQDNFEDYLYKAQLICLMIKKASDIDAYPFVTKPVDMNFLVKNLSPSFSCFYVFSNQNTVFDKDIFVIKREPEFFELREMIDDIGRFSDYILGIDSEFEIISDDNEFKTNSLNLRKKLNGVISTKNLYQDISVADIEKEFFDTKNETKENNTVAIISDGSAVLGFGNIGAEAALPVMEGKAAIFKEMADIDAIPICLKTQNIEEILDICEAISPSFGGINLEDINAPRCFEIEEKLIKRTDIPIFHDDQHGTAIIVLAGLLSALEIVNKQIENVKMVFSGAGAAAQAVAKLMLKAGAKNIIMSDINGIVYKNRPENDFYLEKMANLTNPNNETGDLSVAIKNADVLIGLSKGNIVTPEMIKSMNKDAIVFALANPTPEIIPDLALQNGAKIAATGRSDFKNQINNSLAFPGVFRGVLDKNIKIIGDDIKLKAAFALYNYAKTLGTDEFHLLPNALDKNVVTNIANAF